MSEACQILKQQLSFTCRSPFLEINSLQLSWLFLPYSLPSAELNKTTNGLSLRHFSFPLNSSLVHTKLIFHEEIHLFQSGLPHTCYRRPGQLKRLLLQYLHTLSPRKNRPDQAHNREEAPEELGRHRGLTPPYILPAWDKQHRFLSLKQKQHRARP